MKRKNFFIIFSIILWLIMAIGFSDNWLFDIGQKSNSESKFIIHAFFSFCWFTLLVLQSGLIRKKRFKLHFKLGLFGMVIYYLMTMTIWNLYFESFIVKNDWLKLLRPLESFSILLVTLAFLYRKKNSQKHKEYIIFGTFCLIGPGLDRAVFHIFGPEKMIWPLVILYWALFSSFIWYKKRFTWYMGLWVMFWLYSLYPVLSGMI